MVSGFFVYIRTINSDSHETLYNFTFLYSRHLRMYS